MTTKDVECFLPSLQMPLPRSRSWGVRLVVLAYGAFSVIIVSSYVANLAAFLTVRACIVCWHLVKLSRQMSYGRPLPRIALGLVLGLLPRTQSDPAPLHYL